MKKLLSAIFLSFCAFALSAQSTETVIFNFSKFDDYIKCARKSFAYPDHTDEVWNFSAYSGTLSLSYSYVRDGSIDDYLISPDFELQQGHLYRIDCELSTFTYGKTTNLHFYCGEGEAADAQNFPEVATFMDVPYASMSLPAKRQGEFAIRKTGNYKIALRVEPNNIYLYSVKIIDCGVQMRAEEVNDLLVVPAFNGNSTAEVSFTMPTLSTGGDTLTDDLTYDIYRGEDLIKSGTAAPGAEVKYSDSGMSSGYYTYGLEITYGDIKNDKVTFATYIGRETPTPVTDVQLSGKAGEYKLSWKAPLKGTHDVPLVADKLRYKITRVVGSNKTVLEESYDGLEYTDKFSGTEFADMYYEIVAVYGFESSTAVKSKSVKLGSISLPFADSFAGAVLDPEKWQAEIVEGHYNWKAVARIGERPDESYYTDGPVDEDGGMAMYDFYNAMGGGSARLMTMPISKGSSSAPVVDFYLWRFGGRKQDYIKLQVQIDANEWQDVEGAEWYNIAKESDPAYGQTGWQHYAVDISKYIPADCTTYRVSFTAMSDYGADMAIDAVRIFNSVNHDLEVVSLVAPENVIAGNDLQISLSVGNNGQDVKAADYSIEIESDFPAEIKIESVDIAALDNTQFSITLPVTAEEAFDLKEYSFKAKVVYAADEVTANNDSETVKVKTSFTEFGAPQNVEAKAENDAVRVTWNHAEGWDYEPLNISENFDSFEEGAQGDFNGWKSFDFDKEPGDFAYNIGESEFTVVSGGSPTGGNGNFLGVTVKGNVQQDDWLISPKFSVKPTSDLTFTSRIAVQNRSSSYMIKVEVLYCEEDEYDASNPAASFKSLDVITSGSDRLPQSMAFVNVRIPGIPATAKYVALHFITKTGFSMAMWVDDLKVFETDNNPIVGYHVYERNNGRVTDEALAKEVNEHVIGATRAGEDRMFYVTAVYRSGESEPSNLAKLSNSSAIEDLITSEASILPVLGGVMINGYAGQQAEVYTLDGRKAASIRCTDHTFLPLASGLYIVKTINAAAKIVVN